MSNIGLLIDAPILLVQLFTDGLLIGAIFALAAFGMALVWGVMKIINICQGEFVMLGGYAAVWMASEGFSPFLGIPVAVVLMFLFGWLLYHTIIYRIVDHDLFISILATFGISIVLQQLMNEAFGSDVRIADSGLGTWFIFDGLVTISQVKVVACVLAFILGGCLVYFLKKSRIGQAIRATSQDARAARVLGINTSQVYAITYGLNAAICGACGALVAMAYTIHPYVGLPYTIRSFMIVVVAGLGNLGGVILASLGLGSAENIAGFVLGAEYQLAFVFSLLAIVLVLRNWRLARKRQYLK
jgi:branched-chain amino acid transport system permease protein